VNPAEKQRDSSPCPYLISLSRPVSASSVTRTVTQPEVDDDLYSGLSISSFGEFLFHI